MNKPLISVIIPVYNYGDVVARAINSVLEQLDADNDLIIINDGSTDHSDTTIRQLLQDVHCDNVRYIVKKNGGPSSVRNLGIEKSTGEYLIFLDADDELTSNALAEIKHYLIDEKRPSLIAGRHISIFPDGKERQAAQTIFDEKKENNFQNYLRGKIRLANGPTIMHRSVFENLRYPEQLRQSEDVPVFALALANFNAISIPNNLAKIHKSKTSLRHDYQRMRSIGTQPVDYLFDHPLLPAALHKYYSLTLARRYLSMSRSAYLANEPAECINFFHHAVKKYPLVCLQWSYIGKYLKAVLNTFYSKVFSK